MVEDNKRLSSLRLAVFALPEVPMAAFIMSLVVFVPPFYAGYLGLGLSSVGMIFGLTKLADVIYGPVFGVISDKWRTRWGRRRIWLVASVPIMALCVYMVYLPSAPVSGGYFAFWMTMIYVGWTLSSLSHISWAAELSTNYHERSRISAFRQGATLVGFIGLILMVAIAERTLGLSEADRVGLIGKVLIIAFTLSVLAALWAAPEKDVIVATPKDARLKTWRVLLANVPFRRVLLTNLFLNITLGVVGGLYLFYVDNVLQLGEWAGFALLPFMVSGLLFLPLCITLSKRIGKHKAFSIVAIYQLLAGFLFLVLPAGNLILVSIGFLFLGANQAIANYIPQAIMADVTDCDAVKSGNMRTGLCMSFLQLTSKVASGLAVGISYPLLAFIGFDAMPGAFNSPETLNYFRWLLVIFPGIMYALVALIMWRFPLDEAQQIVLRQQLEAVGCGRETIE